MFLFLIYHIVRKKLPKDKRKISINLTINPYISELLDKHLNKTGINKSKFIEDLLKDKLKK